MKIKKGLIIIFTSFILLGNFPKPYYPINIEIRIKSIFASFRGNHFHGGLDFSTFRKIGVPVRAIADGYIFRLSNKFYGFGKAIYIRHKNFISVCGHLDRFENKKLKLEDLSKKLAKNFDGRYFGDYFFKGKGVFVKKGQIVAYTGETGAGPPHLHFETRDLNNNPINTFNFIKIDDKIPPRIGKFIIKPLTPHSFINGELKPFTVKVNKRSKPKKLFISGPFSITVTSWDKYYEFDRTGIYGWKAYIDDKLISEIKFDKIPFSESHQIALIYDINRSSYKKDYFFYNIYPYYGEGIGKNYLGASELFNSLNEGEHTIRLKVFDFWGNSINKSVKFIKIPLKKLEIINIRKIAPNKIKLKLKENPLKIYAEVKGSEEVLFYKPKVLKKGNILIINIPRPFDGDKYIVRIKKCKFCPWTIKEFPITAKSFDGFQLKKGKNWIEIDSEIKGKWKFGIKKGKIETGKNIIPIYNGILKLSFKNKSYTFVFKRNGKHSVNKKILLPDGIALYSNNKLKEEFLSIQNSYYKKIEPDFKEFFFIKKGEEKEFSSGKYSLKFFKNSLYKDFYFRIKKNGTLYDPELPPLISSITILPDNFPFKKSLMIKVDFPNYEFKKRVGFFRFNKTTGKWVSLKSQVKNNKIFSKIWIGGTYAVLADESPPELKIYSPKKGKRYKNVIRAVAIVRDKGKGIDYHKTFFIINGKKVWAYYDPDKASMYYPISNYLRKGKNSLTAIVYDYAGNKSVKNIYFYKR